MYYLQRDLESKRKLFLRYLSAKWTSERLCRLRLLRFVPGLRERFRTRPEGAGPLRKALPDGVDWEKLHPIRHDERRAGTQHIATTATHYNDKNVPGTIPVP